MFDTDDQIGSQRVIDLHGKSSGLFSSLAAADLNLRDAETGITANPQPAIGLGPSGKAQAPTHQQCY